MRQLNVFVVSARDQDLLSAQLISVKEVHGFSAAGAAAFLAQHPDTLVVCEGWSNSCWKDCVARLISEGHPSASIVISGSRFRTVMNSGGVPGWPAACLLLPWDVRSLAVTAQRRL